jgi:hypothetical protein
MLKPPTAMFGPAVAAKVLREAVIGSAKTGGSVSARETLVSRMRRTSEESVF